jgi:EpsI family protein
VTLRACALAVMILAAGTWSRASGPREVVPERPLSTLPQILGAWRGIDGAPVEPEIARVLGADDYLNRVYRRSDGSVAALWIAFYASQRQGDAIHSPLNCLPGNGWTPVEHTRPIIHSDGQQLRVNRYVVEKRGERQLVMYWFQGRGRVVASEYANKAFLLVDAIRQRRTDGALVRVTLPIRGDGANADHAAAAFVASLQPELTEWLP